MKDAAYYDRLPWEVRIERDLREARQSLIVVMLHRGDPIPEPLPVRTGASA